MKDLLKRDQRKDALAPEQPGSGLGIDWNTATKNKDQKGANDLWNQNGKGQAVPGEFWTVKTTKGTPILVWKGTTKDVPYFCHGATFGGDKAAKGPFSPLGNEVPTIIKEGYTEVTDLAKIKKGSVLVITGPAGNVLHSAIFSTVVITNGEVDLGKTMLDTKNGTLPRATMSLGDLFGPNLYTVPPNMTSVWNRK
jgi:hypothetical protein